MSCPVWVVPSLAAPSLAVPQSGGPQSGGPQSGGPSLPFPSLAARAWRKSGRPGGPGFLVGWLQLAPEC